MRMSDMEIVMLSEEEATKLVSDRKERIRQRMVPLTEKQAESAKQMDFPTRKNYMRNRPCPCNSGRKFKRCCWSKFRPDLRQ